MNTLLDNFSINPVGASLSSSKALFLSAADFSNDPFLLFPGDDIEEGLLASLKLPSRCLWRLTNGKLLGSKGSVSGSPTASRYELKSPGECRAVFQGPHDDFPKVVRSSPFELYTHKGGGHQRLDERWLGLVNIRRILNSMPNMDVQISVAC